MVERAEQQSTPQRCDCIRFGGEKIYTPAVDGVCLQNNVSRCIRSFSRRRIQVKNTSGRRNWLQKPFMLLIRKTHINRFLQCKGLTEFISGCYSQFVRVNTTTPSCIQYKNGVICGERSHLFLPFFNINWINLQSMQQVAVTSQGKVR